MSAQKNIEEATQAAGEAKETNPSNPSIISSGGAIGKQVRFFIILQFMTSFSVRAFPRLSLL